MTKIDDKDDDKIPLHFRQTPYFCHHFPLISESTFLN